METVLYFLLFGALIFLMMRFGCGAHVMGHGRSGHDPGRSSTETSSGGTGRESRLLDEDTDPVCGMTVKTAAAKSSFHAGRAFYFCSTDCRETFEADPGRYAKAIATSHERKEHRHGCC